MRVLWLADVLRGAGLTVVEHDGWKTHGWDDWDPQAGLVHATAAPSWQRDDVQVSIVRDGRSDLEGPIAVACLDRAARWHVLASGRCNTTLTGTAGPFEGYGNRRMLGVEACNDNLTEAWPPAQYEAYARGWAAICRRMGWGADRLVGHKEHTPGRKTDPTFDMGRFRARVAQILAGEDDMFEQADRDKLTQIHSLLTGGTRGPGLAVTSGGGVPVDAINRQFWEVDGALSILGAAQQRIEAKLAELAERDDSAPVGQVTTEQLAAVVEQELREVFSDAGSAG